MGEPHTFIYPLNSDAYFGYRYDNGYVNIGSVNNVARTVNFNTVAVVNVGDMTIEVEPTIVEEAVSFDMFAFIVEGSEEWVSWTGSQDYTTAVYHTQAQSSAILTFANYEIGCDKVVATDIELELFDGNINMIDTYSWIST